jgi:RNA polymerase sigma factor (TIGR02999 family)
MPDSKRKYIFTDDEPVLSESKTRLTIMLQEWSNGDRGALEKLAPLVHQELRRLARGYLARERPGHVLQISALINEAYIRLIDWRHVRWKNRAHFFGIAAGLMRNVLVDIARAEDSDKRGGRISFVSLDPNSAVFKGTGDAIVAVHEALERLAAIDVRKAQVVEMLFFGGLTKGQTATVLGVSVSTVESDWRFAKAWLKRELSDGKSKKV